MAEGEFFSGFIARRYSDEARYPLVSLFFHLGYHGIARGVTIGAILAFGNRNM